MNREPVILIYQRSAILAATSLLVLSASPTAASAARDCEATFDAPDHRLSVICLENDDTIHLTRDPGSNIHLSDQAGSLSVTGGAPTTSNVDRIDLTMSLGNDAIIIDQTEGLFTPGATAEPGVSEIEIVVAGDAGDDSLTVRGWNAADTIDIGPDSADLTGDDDTDVSWVEIESLVVDGQSGDDRLNAGGAPEISGPLDQAVTLFGGPGADQLTGSDAEDLLTGDEGNDLITGGLGSDQVLETQSQDWDLRTGAGFVTMASDDELDELHEVESVHLTTGDTDNTIDVDHVDLPVTIFAGGGRDRLNAMDSPMVIINGESGNDTIVCDDNADTQVVIRAGDGDDRVQNFCNGVKLFAEGGNDEVTSSERHRRGQIDAGDGNDNVRSLGGLRVLGGPGFDDLTGGRFPDTLIGGTGDDRLTGGAGGDLLIGGDDDDVCAGGSGKDRLRSCENRQA